MKTSKENISTIFENTKEYIDEVGFDAFFMQKYELFNSSCTNIKKTNIEDHLLFLKMMLSMDPNEMIPNRGTTRAQETILYMKKNKISSLIIKTPFTQEKVKAIKEAPNTCAHQVELLKQALGERLLSDNEFIDAFCLYEDSARKNGPTFKESLQGRQIPYVSDISFEVPWKEYFDGLTEAEENKRIDAAITLENKKIVLVEHKIVNGQGSGQTNNIEAAMKFAKMGERISVDIATLALIDNPFFFNKKIEDIDAPVTTSLMLEKFDFQLLFG